MLLELILHEKDNGGKKYLIFLYKGGEEFIL